MSRLGITRRFRAGADHPEGARLTIAVIGASLTGLFAAAAAAAAGHEVILLERDQLTGDGAARSGVPQGRQPHVFLARGLLAAERLLPGLRAELEARGAVPLNAGMLPWCGEEGWVPIRSSDLHIISLTRPLFEAVVRERVLALDGVRLRDGCRVQDLHRPADQGSRWSVELKGGEQITADLVIDASGRGSRLPVWLQAMGIAAPKVSEVDARLAYATCEYRDGPRCDPFVGVVLPCTPVSPAGGLVLPVEDGRWLVLAVGAGEDRPPRDFTGFREFLRRLPDPAVSEFVDRSTTDGEVLVHRQTGNRRYHYESLRHWPDRLLVMGDALVAFNPVFGQGITVGACEALELGDWLAAGRSRDTRRLMRRFAAVAALPWSIAIGQDLRQPTSTGRQTRTQAMTNAWVRELSTLGVHGNIRAITVLTRLYHLVGSPASLFHPAFGIAAVRARLFGYGPAAPRPASLDVVKVGAT